MNTQIKQNNGQKNNCNRMLSLPFWAIAILLMSILLAACGGGQEEPTPIPLPTPPPTAESEPTVSPEEPANESELKLAETTTEQAEPDAGLIAEVNTAQLQYRTAPGEDSDVIRLLELGEQFVVVGRDVDGAWLKVVRQDEVPGWLSAKFVTLNGATAQEIEALTERPTVELAEEEVTTAAPEIVLDDAIVTINADYLNVRLEPQADSDISLLAQRGQQFEVIAVNEDNTWLQIATSDGPLGWVAREFVIIGENETDEAEAVAVETGDAITGTAESLVTEDSATEDADTEDAATEGVTTETVADGESTESAAEEALTLPETVPSTALQDSPVTMGSPEFGGQAFLWWRSEIADRDLDLMTEAGFGWVKQTFAWEDIEGRGKGEYSWAIADRVVQQVNSRGLKLLARVSSDPLADFWAGHPPGNANDFAEFVFELAARYDCTAEAVGCIHAFQIWNEPNLAREWGDKPPNPAEYVAFLGKAYNAIKNANENSVVINAGMAPTGDYSDIAMPDDVFYQKMYEAMGGNSDGFFDLLGVHGAGFAAPPELDPAEAAVPDSPYGGYRFFSFRHVEDIREIMVQNGDDDKQIVLLEFGWTYDSVNPSYKWHGSDAGIDAALQGKYLLRAYEFAEENWQPWIGLMSLLTMPNLAWLDDGNPEDEEQYWWAILDPSPIDQLYLRPAYVELCIYFNNAKGQRCAYDPN